MKLFQMFKDSAKEFQNPRAVAMTSLLIAIHTILAFFVSIQLSDSLRISVSFICKVVIGAFYGPVVGFVSGGLCDIIQFIIKPMGAFNPGFTLNAALAGLIYGLFFYKKFPQKNAALKADWGFLLRCILCISTETVIVNMLLGTFWLSKLIGTPFWVMFGPRAIKNLIQLPINIFLTYYVLYFMKKIYNHMRN